MEVVEDDDDLDSSNDPEKLSIYSEVLFINFKQLRHNSIDFKLANFKETECNVILTDSQLNYFESNKIDLELKSPDSRKLTGKFSVQLQKREVLVMTTIDIIFIVIFLMIAIILAVPIGKYMSKVFTGQKTFMDPVMRPLERFIYRVVGVDQK